MFTNTQTSIGIYYCYDAPTLAPRVFDDFMAIQPVEGNVTIQSYSDLIRSMGANTNGTRLVVRLPYVLYCSWNRVLTDSDTVTGYLHPQEFLQQRSGHSVFLSCF